MRLWNMSRLRVEKTTWCTYAITALCKKSSLVLLMTGKEKVKGEMIWAPIILQPTRRLQGAKQAAPSGASS
jgi:hypothetical protein